MATSPLTNGIVFPALLLVVLLSLYGIHCRTIANDRLPTYRVAVFEYAVISASEQIDSREMALQAMRKNIVVYNHTAITAQLKGVKMLVFPEYGIYGTRMTRERMSLFAETIPDPKISHRNPCKDPEFKGQNTEVQRLLSCIARDNGMFLVVNMAGREVCDHEEKCPPDGQYLYNTNVIFSPKGDLVARYYKTHLFEENWFNHANRAEVVTFDTPFGKFGTFVCFDVMFKKPAVEAVEKYKIRNFVTPVAWVKAPPFFRSIQMHSSFARRQKINFLVSNLHLPPSYGSGIYTPKGAAAYNYRPKVSGSKLIVADIHKIDGDKPDGSESYFNYSREVETEEYGDYDVLSVPDMTKQFTFKHLKKQSGSITACHKSFCCKVSYAARKPFQETYAVGVYSGYLLSSGNKLYLQICTLLKCPSSKCGTEIGNVKTEFSHISIQGVGFSTKYVYPSVLAMQRRQYVLVPDSWTYSKGKGIQNRSGKAINLHSANLVGRVYSKDIIVREALKEEQPPKSQNFIERSVEYLLYLAAFIFGYV